MARSFRLPNLCQVPLGQDEAVGLKACLERRGLPVSVVPVKRADWIRVFVGILLDAESRAGNGTADGAYGWYLDLAKKAVEENTASTGKACVLVGHSAGGWLGRALMQREGREPWFNLSLPAALEDCLPCRKGQSLKAC